MYSGRAVGFPIQGKERMSRTRSRSAVQMPQMPRKVRCEMACRFGKEESGVEIVCRHW